MTRINAWCVLLALLLEALVPAAGSMAASMDAAWKAGPGAAGSSTYDGYIDAPAPGARVAQHGTLELSGWFVDRAAQGWAGADDVEVFLGLMNDGGRPLSHALFAQPRPDVAAALGNPYWSASGWSALIATSALVDGPNTLTVYAHAPDKGWWYKQVSVSVGEPPSNAQPAAGSGYDASYPECGQPRVGPSGFAIVGVNGGRAFTPNPCLAQEYAQALGTTSPTQAHLSFYLNTGNPGPGVSPHWPSSGAGLPRACDGTASADCAYDYGWLAAHDAVDRARRVAGGLAVQVPWWLDVEVDNSWSEDVHTNSADLQGVIAGLQDQEIGWIGIYALRSGWEQIVGYGPAGAPFVDLPNWRPGAHSAAEAPAWCQRTVTGGAVKFAQYPHGSTDANYPCS